MKSCILTVIKNEHEYLDEWIKYHLDLGIDHIFIFEDLDSESHKEICNKYGNKVSLNVISIILNDVELKEVLKLKLSKKRNIQDIYFSKTLMWIKNTYNDMYNWCFVIDIDEFITFENKNDNLNILSLYKDYDAIILQWKIYGANNNIFKPDYSKFGVIDTYIKPSNYVGHSVLEWTTKTCYNINNFKKIFYKGCHQPTDYCKWCRTDFSHSRTNLIHSKIYIRHYMTKSWEEYISKRKRGYFMGFARTIDIFFNINPDMLYLKNELINNLKQETLVVLPYKQNGSQGNEIKLTLSLWKKFCQFDYHFIVIGEYNEFLKQEFPWVEFIYCPTKEKIKNQYNPHLDIQNKFNIIMKKYSNLYDGFIYMSDDYYAIKPFGLKDIMKIYYLSSNFIGNKNQPISYWNHDKWKTRQLLDRENLPHINYTTHYPYFFEFKKLKEIWHKFNMLEESYVFDDVYFNYFKHEEPEQVDKIRLGIWNNYIYKNKFQKAIDNPNIKFICNSVDGWSNDLEESLRKLIDKS